NVRHFEYRQDRLFVPELLILLRAWRASLSRLSISIIADVSTRAPTSDWNALLQVLHELPHLRQLMVDDHNAYPAKFDIPNLPQLETFFFGLQVGNVERAESFISQS